MNRNQYWYWGIIGVFGSCWSSNSILEIPKNTRLIAKYVTLDEVLSRKGVFCDYDSIRFFLEMKEFDCMFKLQNFQFKIGDKFKIGADGKIVEYLHYAPMGPLTYDTTQLKADPGFAKHMDLDRFFVQISADRTRILDLLDTCEIEKIYFKEKLILMKQNERLQKKNQRILYQYY
jgi:hypothetical protein